MWSSLSGPNGRLRVPASEVARPTSALPHHQRDGVQPRGGALVLAVQVAHQPLPPGGAELGHGNVDRGQLRMDELQSRDVVKSSHRDIVGDTEALAPQLCKSAEPHRVAGHDHRAGTTTPAGGEPVASGRAVAAAPPAVVKSARIRTGSAPAPFMASRYPRSRSWLVRRVSGPLIMAIRT